jgi:hypothetical protein
MIDEKAQHDGQCHTGGSECPECKAELENIRKEFIGLVVTGFEYAGPEGGYIELDHRYKIKFPVAMIMKRQVQ